MPEAKGSSQPARQVCPVCLRDDTIGVETLGPGYWRYACSNQRRHPGNATWTWEGTATSRSDEEEAAGGKTEELGLYDDLPMCLVPGEPFVEYGIVEFRYGQLRPKVYEQLLSDYGHTRLARNKEFTASAFIAKALGELDRRGEVVLAWGKATGYWAYNSVLSYWALPPGPADPGARYTYEEFARTSGLDPLQ